MHKHPHLIHLAYRSDIDGLRALAVMLVLFFHASQGEISGAFIGVDIFFVISGYLISKIIFSSLEKDRFSFREFYIRRIRRIFPALVLVLVTCTALGYFTLLKDEYRDLGKHIAGGAFFSENFILWSETGYFDKDATAKPFLHLWSLAIEEQFYLLWPVLLVFIWKRQWSFIKLTSTIFVLSFCANLYLIWQDRAGAFYLPQARFWELMVGGILAYLSLHPRRQFILEGNFRSTVGLAFIVASLIFLDTESAFPGFWALLPTLGAALIISARPDSWVNEKLLSNNAAVFIGKISYPLYLWHWPLIAWLHIQKGTELNGHDPYVAVVISFILAWITYKFVETPLRQGKNSGVKAGVLLTALLCSGFLGIYLYLSGGLPNRNAASTEVIYDGDVGHEDFYQYATNHYHRCAPADIAAAAMNWGEFIRCQQSLKKGEPEIAVIGDSHAEHLFLGLAKQFPDTNIAYYIKTTPPIIDVPDFERIFEYTLTNNSINTVVLTAYWRKHINKSGDPKLFEIRLKQTIQRLVAAGKVVYLTDDIPNFPFPPNRCRLKGARYLFPDGCSMDGQDPEIVHKRTLDILQPIIQAVPGSHLIETYKYFCADGRCSMTLDSKLLYRDAHHLNINGSLYLGNILAKRLASEN